MTKLAPGRITSMMMGLWFLSSFFGNYFSGFLGTYWERMTHESYFAVLAGPGLAPGIASWLLGRAIDGLLGD